MSFPEKTPLPPDDAPLDPRSSAIDLVTTPPNGTLVDLLTRDLDPADLTTGLVRANIERFAAGAVLKKGDETEAAAISRLRGKSFRPGWKLSLTLACVAFLGLVFAANHELAYLLASSLGSDPPTLLSGFKEKAFGRFVDPDAVYSPVAKSEEEWCERTRKAFDRQPGSAAAYFLHASIFKLIKRQLPPDFDTVTSRLEPDNAIWPLLKSDYQIGRAIDLRVSRTELDPEWASRAVASLRAAAACPRIDYHLHETGQLWRRGLHPVTVAEAVMLSPGQMSGDRLALHPETNFTSALILGAKQIPDPEARKEFLRMTGPLMIRYLSAAGIEGRIPAAQMAKSASAVGLIDETIRFKKLEKMSDSALQNMLGRSGRDGKWNAFLDGSRFWPNFYEDWGASELDLRLMNRVAGLKVALLSSAAFCLVAGLLAWLRLIPRPAIPTKIARCLGPLSERLGSMTRAAVVLTATLSSAWGVAGIVQSTNQDFSRILPIVLGGGALLGLSFVFQSARASIARSTAVVGLRPTDRRLMLGRLMKLLVILALGLWVASTYAEDFQIFAIFIAGSVILVWLACIGLGYADPVDSIRHRLMARFLLPVFFTASFMLGVIGMGVGAFERHLVQEAWAAAPGPLSELSPETKAGLEALVKEWQ